MAKYSDINDFKEYELFPALFENLDKIFPKMGFKRNRGNWISSYHLNGVQDSNKKTITYVYANSKKHLIQDLATGEKPNLINFYMKYYGFGEEAFREAIDELSQKLNLTSPYFDNKNYKEQKQKQDNKKAALKAFTSALWEDTPEAKEVLDYLHSRTWTDDEIKEAELGLVTTAILNTLPNRDEFKITDKDYQPIGTSHTLAIPFEQGSQLKGFKVREAREKLRSKSRYLNTPDIEKSSLLFGLGIGDETLVIVEGELDALLARVRVKNIPPVVATAGGALSPAQFDEAKRRGVKRLILLYDNDEAGKKYTLKVTYDDKGRKLDEEGTIPLCEKRGIPTYVATLPDDSKDVNDFFIKGHTKEELSELINNARPSYLYRYDLIVKKYVEIEEKEEKENRTFTPLDRDAFLFEVGEITNNLSIMGHAGNRELIYNELEKVKDSLLLGLDGFRDFLNNQYFKMVEQKRLEEIAAKRDEELEQASEKIATLRKEGKQAEAAQFMKETGEKILLQDKEPEYTKVFTPLSPKEYRKLLSEIKEGLPTGYCFTKGKRREALTLNVGLTFICGLRAHGKTTFLNNIALNEVERQLYIQENGGAPQSVLYFSYEIDKRRLIASLLNTFVNDPELSDKPLATVYNYYKNDDEAQYFKGGRTGKHFNDFVKKEEKFMFNYLSSGLLTIVDEPYLVENLLEAIKYYVKTAPRPVSLVCIDYAQQIYSEAAKTKARYEEIKKIVNDIKNFANKESLPFVLAAQFNRKDVSSPVSVDTTSIGEGGDFERIADTCIGLFNLKELHTPKKEKGEREELESLLRKHKTQIEYLIKQAKDEYGNPQTIDDYDAWAKNPQPKEGVLFVRLIKRRYGDFPLDAFLKWEGKTGYIEQNDREHFLIPPTQTELFQAGEVEEDSTSTPKGGNETNTKDEEEKEPSITDDVTDDLPF